MLVVGDNAPAEDGVVSEALHPGWGWEAGVRRSLASGRQGQALDVGFLMPPPAMFAMHHHLAQSHPSSEGGVETGGSWGQTT